VIKLALIFRFFSRRGGSPDRLFPRPNSVRLRRLKKASTPSLRRLQRANAIGIKSCGISRPRRGC